MGRDIDVDVAKGICIMLVIARHMEVFYQIGVISCTYIAVPLFFFMSGFYIKTETSFWVFLKNNIKRIILPAIIWTLLALCYNIPLQYLNKGFCVIEFDWISPTPANGPLWFLFALFYAKMLFYFLAKIKSNVLVIFFSLIFGYLGVKYEMPCYFNDGLAAIPFFVVGEISYKHLNYLRDNIYLLLLGVISFVLFCSNILDYEIIPISINHYKLSYLVSIGAVMLSFLPFLKIVHYLKVDRLAQMGLHTMGILCIHVQICHSFAVIIRKIVAYGSDGWIYLSLISFVIVVFLSYYFTVFLEKKIPFVFGKF